MAKRPGVGAPPGVGPPAVPPPRVVELEFNKSHALRLPIQRR